MKQILIILSALIVVGCNSEKGKIRSVCNTFIDGRIKMYETGDLSLLNKVSSDKLDSLHIIYNEEMQLLFSEGYNNQSFISSNKVESIKEIVISGDSATCIMSGISFKEVNLIKNNGVWLVYGQNGEYVTSELIKERQQKLLQKKEESENIQKSKPLLSIVEKFKGELNKMFEKNDFSDLDDCCSIEVIEFMKMFVDYCLKQESLESIKEKKESFKTWVGHTTFSENRAVCKFNNEENRTFNFALDDSGKWQIVGFNNFMGDELNEKNIKLHYQSFLKVFGIFGDKRI